MPTGDQVGRKFIYNHGEGVGFGQHHAEEPLISEMREIDLAAGTEVVLFTLDVDSRAPIIQWTDSTGLERLTTVDPEFFDQYFMAV